MSEIKKSGVFAAAVFALAVPNLALAESLREPSDFGDDPDGAEIYVQLDEDVSDDVSDEGSEDYASDEDSTDVSDENTGASDDVAEVDDAWVTTTGEGDGPIYLEFASGSGPMQRDVTPAPNAPDNGNSAPVLVAADRIDVTLGINVHDKVAVAAQCAALLEQGEIYQAFYKLYCD